MLQVQAVLIGLAPCTIVHRCDRSPHLSCAWKSKWAELYCLIFWWFMSQDDSMTAWAYPINVMTCRSCSILHLRGSSCCSLQFQVGAKQETDASSKSCVRTEERMGLGAVRVNCATANVSEVAFLFKDICCLVFGVWTIGKQQCRLHVWLPMGMGGAWERVGSCEIITNCVPSCIQTCNILPRNSQVGSGKPFSWALLWYRFFLWQGTIHISCRFEIRTLFFFCQISRCLHVAGGAIVWLGISDISVNMFK